MVANNVPCCEPLFWVYLVICMTLVAFAGLMSGLTLGLMSLSLVDLEVLTKAGLPEDQKNAAKILPIVKNQHLLLCTLLICNALAMEALPIFLDVLLPAWGAILISVTLILAFGEIIPQAVCSRYGLSVGAKLSVVVRLLVIVVFPISYPISKLLDFLLGKEHSALLRRAELKALVHMHGNEAGKGGDLTRDETTIISGALELTQKTVKDVMTPIAEIFALDINFKLNEETMSLIISKGHSRVPVYSGRPTNIVGLILVKNLIKCHPEDETPVRNLTIRRIPRVYDGMPLFDILNQFQKGHSHMAAVVSDKNNVKGTVKNVRANKDMIKTNISSHSSIQKQAGGKGLGCQFGPNRLQNICISKYASSAISNDSESQSPAPEDVMVRDSDEDAIGIITMEDVLEELLQEEILDETDEYVDVHKKIKINMLPPRMSSRSPGAPSTSCMNWRTPAASPLSSGHQTPASPCYPISMLRSPLSPYIQSPIMRPTLSASSGKSMPSSPAGSAGVACSSPSSYLVGEIWDNHSISEVNCLNLVKDPRAQKESSIVISFIC